MPDELRPDLVFAMSDAIDKILLSWEPAMLVIVVLVPSSIRARHARREIRSPC